MVNFLKSHFQNDINKEYLFIDDEVLAKIRLFERMGRPVPGCRAARVLSFFPNGDVKMSSTIKDFMNSDDAISDDIVSVDKLMI